MEEDEDSLERLLYIFVCNDKEKLDKLYSEDEIMKKVVEKVSNLTEDFANELYYDREQIINDYSFDLGVEQRNIDIAKEMLKDNESLDKSSKYTGLSIEEIKNL